jgi:hypothetical protein
MDYRKLLKKYIEHVGWCEGVSFLGEYDRTEFFTDDEWKEMREIDNEVLVERKERNINESRSSGLF